MVSRKFSDLFTQHEPLVESPAVSRDDLETVALRVLRPDFTPNPGDARALAIKVLRDIYAGEATA